MRGRRDVILPEPGSAALLEQAELAWQPRYDPRVMEPLPDFSAVAAQFNAAAAAVGGGARSAEPDALPYHQPGTRTMRGGPTAPGSAPGLAYGPVGWNTAAVEAEVRAAMPVPPPQYSPEGQLLVEPVTWTLVSPEEASCICLSSRRLVPYSLAAALVEPYNALKVRGLLVQAGLVKLTPELENWRGQDACRILGGPHGGYSGLAAYALQYNDTPYFRLPSPVAMLDFLNTAYVTAVLTSARATLGDAARANYARVMGGVAAACQPRPQFWEDPATAGPLPLPAVLPGTGALILEPEDTRFASLALMNPVATARNVAAFAAATGMPIAAVPPPLI